MYRRRRVQDSFFLLFFGSVLVFLCNSTRRALGFTQTLISMCCAICGWVVRAVAAGAVDASFLNKI